jgi:alcohol dehydrogenase
MMHAFEEPLTVETVDDPAPGPDGVVIEVRATGVCRSDWHAWMGHDTTIKLPHVPGHELAGVIAAVGPEVRGVREGDRVTAPFCCGCGRCEQCRRGETQVCENQYQAGFTAWGSFARYVGIPRADLNIVALPEALDFVEAAALGCRFMTAWAAVHVHGRAAPGEWVAIHGCGGIGLSAIMIASALGATVVAVDVDDSKLERARAFGAAHTVDAREGDPSGPIRELTGGGAHVSLDALGSAQTCVASIRSLRRQGRHVQVGLLLADDRKVALPMARVLAYELEVLGVHGMAVRHYDALLRAVAGGTLEPGRLIGKTIALEDAGAELESMGRFAQKGITVITEPG